MSDLAWFMLEWGSVGVIVGAVLVQACLLCEALWEGRKVGHRNNRDKTRRQK